MATTKQKFYSRYNYEKTPGLKCLDKSRTKQSFKEDADINNIMKKYLEKGILPNMIKTDPQYGDFSTVEDYQSSLNTVMKAQTQFEALPAKVRDRFKNDPMYFLQFTSDPNNKEELAKLGLLKEVYKEPEAPVEPNKGNPEK